MFEMSRCREKSWYAMRPAKTLTSSFREVKVARRCVAINQIRITYKFVPSSAVPSVVAQWSADWMPA